jgi:hypothetical protein
VDAEGVGDFPDRFSFFEQPPSEFALICIRLLWASEANATSPGVGAASSGALADEVSLEFRDVSEDGHDHFAGVSCGVSPGLGNGLKASACAPYTFYYLEQIASGTGQPVKFPNSDDIAFSKLIEHPVQFRTIAVGASDLLAKESPAPRFLERFDLKSQPLIFGGDTSIANFHTIAPTFFAKYIAIEIRFARYFCDQRLADFRRIRVCRETYKFCDSPDTGRDFCACRILDR